MKYLFLLLFLCSFLFSGEMTRAESKQIIIGISTGYPPYYFKKEEKLVGVCIDVIDYTMKALGYKTSYRQYPWKRMLYNAKQGAVDAIMPLFKTKERESFLYFPRTALALEENSFFTWKQSGINYSGNFRDLIPYKIGVVSNYSYGKAFDQVNYFIKEEAINDHSLVKKFKLRRFDVGIGNEYVINFHAKQLMFSERLVFLKPSVTKEPLYIGFSKAKGHLKLMEKFNLELASFKLTKQYEKTMKHYGIH